MTDLVDLATEATKFLAPFVPYLVAGGKEFAEKAGGAAWQKAEEIWKMITARTSDDTGLSSAADLLSADPNNSVFLAAFKETLVSCLKSDAELETSLRRAVEQNRRDQQVSASDGGSIERVTQQMARTGKQKINAEGGTIKDVIQKM